MGMAYMTSHNYEDPDSLRPTDDYRRNYARDTIEVPMEIFSDLRHRQNYLDEIQRQSNQQMQMAMHPLFTSQQTHIARQLSPSSLQRHMTVIGAGGAGGNGGGPGASAYSSPTNLPMGISEWREHGKRHGYWDYFKDEVKREITDIHAGAAMIKKDIDYIRMETRDIKDRMTEMIFGSGLSTTGRGVRMSPDTPKIATKEADDKVKITPNITIGDKVSIKKHVPIIIK